MGGLRLVLLDGGGAPARQAVEGRLTASWKKGQKRVTWEGGAIKLPAPTVGGAGVGWGEGLVFFKLG